MLPVPRSDLGKLEFIDDGSFGTIYKTAYTLRDSTELVYKEYKVGAAGRGRVNSGASAEKAVRFRDDLLIHNPGAPLELDKYFAWPREVVIDDATNKTCGFLMPLAPTEFFWQQGQQANLPRTLDWLTTTEQFWRANQVDLSDITATDRLFLMVQLVYAIALLHKEGWVFGDLSFTNVAFALYPPRLMLFDCDDSAELTDPHREEQPHSPNWRPPECLGSQPLKQQDFVTDVYKLGLAIVRCLKPGPGTTTTKDVTRLADILDADGMQLLTETLSSDRSARPTAKELFTYLEGLTAPRMVPPLITHADLVTPLLPPGANARVNWQIDGAEKIRVFFGDNPAQEVLVADPVDSPDGCAFAVTQSGSVTIEASNRYGTVRRVIGDVALFEIPQFSFDPLTMPRPQVPPVPGYTAAPLPPLPAGHPGAPAIPPVPSPQYADALRDLAPGRDITSPGAHINTVLDGSRSALDALYAENERFSAGLRRKNTGNGTWLSAIFSRA